MQSAGLPAYHAWFALREERTVGAHRYIVDSDERLARSDQLTVIDAAARRRARSPGNAGSTSTSIIKPWLPRETTRCTGPYSLEDVPYVQFFKGAYALHGAFWHDRFGRPSSHGCINLAPEDARWLFDWTTPTVPRAFHAAYPSESAGRGTVLVIRGTTPGG
jgi:hypothetical protein